MGKHWLRQTFDIIGDHITPTSKQGIRLRGPVKTKGGSRAGTHTQIGMVACGLDNGQQVIRQGRIKPNLTRLLLQSHNTLRIQVRLKAIDRIALPVPFKNGALGGTVGVSNGQPHHETVQLTFRKRIGAFKFVGVLCGQHEKRRAQEVSLTIEAHLHFRHGFQQSRLSARAGTIDLIGQNDMGKDWSGLKLKGAGILHQNAGAQKIAGKKIGGKLNAVKVAPKTPR
jgi:hypothetical protein